MHIGNKFERVVGGFKNDVRELEDIIRSLKASSYRPKELDSAAKELFDEFFDQCCIFDGDSRINATELWEAFKAWVKENTVENPFLSQKAFGGYLGSLPFLTKCKTEGRIFYSGIRWVRDGEE